jgi:hypothetical protein
MANYPEMLGAVQLTDIQLGNTVFHDYFYVPVFTTSEYSEEIDDAESFRLEIEVSPGEYDQKGYTSKVPKGQTLWQSIKNDLQKDFNYPVNDVRSGNFRITSIHALDSMDNKEGQPLDRFLVYIYLYEKFDTSEVEPLGLKCRWTAI